MGKSRRPRSRTGAASGHRVVKAPKLGRSLGTVTLTAAVTLLVLAALGTAGLAGWSRWSTSTLAQPEAFQVEVGESTDQLAARLAKVGGVDSSFFMGLYLGTLGRMGAIEPGPHLLPAKSPPRLIAQCLSRTPDRPAVEVVFPEGFDHVRVAQRLEQRGVCAADSFVSVVRERGLLDRLGITGPDAEGYVFPAGYRVLVDSAPGELLLRFVAETRQRLRKIDARLGGGQLERLVTERGWGEHEILTLASMIEKEAMVDEERPIIASVFYNRLDSGSFRPKRMLQSDPTAGYGCLVQADRIASCREYQRRIVPAMLRDSSNPYNTYRHPGLPPGPIASPGEASITSVLKPATTDYLFFVATGTGRHRFSQSLEEHEARIRGGDKP